MTPYWVDDHLTLYGGDCRAVLSELEPQSVNTVVTSPPYWGLRDYGVAGQLGLEASVGEYVDNMVEVFAAVWRVLRDDGTLWLNIGDAYAGNGYEAHDKGAASENAPSGWKASRRGQGAAKTTGGKVKPKDLVGIPWRVALALQDDGWYLRSDIVWSKPNPMPESAKDRPTHSHEYVFLLTKSPRYFYDADSVREPHQQTTLARIEHGLKHRHPTDVGVAIPPVDTDRMGERFAHPLGRNMRSVWTISTESYPGAHFATFPRKLVEPCVKAGSPEGGVVLDPFAGSGTTLVVAQALGRRGVGIDLNPDYLAQAIHRNRQMPLGLGGAA